MAVALVLVPGVARADAGDAQATDDDGSADVGDAADDARAWHDDAADVVIPLYGAPREPGRGGGCATTDSSEPTAALLSVAVALGAVIRRRRP